MVKVGLVLSGGGARGFAHIGVLKVLKKNNINIDAISGCSSGAIIGAFYAHDLDPDRMESFAMKIKNFNDIFDFSFSKTGLMKGDKLENYIKNYLKKKSDTVADASKPQPSSQAIDDGRVNKYVKDYLKKDEKKLDYNFEDLKIPLCINSTDIIDGHEVIMDKGPLVPAIMASIAYPGIFTTRKINEKIFVDGGVVNPLPFQALKGMDYLILVDVSRQKTKITQDSNFKDVMIQSLAIMQSAVVERFMQDLKQEHVLIEPKVFERNEFDFKNVESAIKEGEKSANDAVDKIKQDIERISKALETPLITEPTIKVV